MRLAPLVLLLCVLFGTTGPGFGQTAQGVFIQIEAQPDLDQARAAARDYALRFPELQGFRLSSGWYGLMLGPYSTERAQERLRQLRGDGEIPGDSFVTEAGAAGASFWPEAGVAAAAAAAAAVPGASTAAEAPAQAAAAPVAEAPAVAPLAAPDGESPKEAKRSEARLSREERNALQEALAWYGHYSGTLDGAFGKATRQAMADWQTARGAEATGILTTAQRAAIVADHARDLAEFGFATVTEPEAGIAITLPGKLMAFDRYDPPFVVYRPLVPGGPRLMLISEPGDRAALSELFGALQSLKDIPAEGPRSLGESEFEITGAGETGGAYSLARLQDGAIKGFVVTWDNGHSDQITRVLPVLKASFRAAGDMVLDPGLVPLEAGVKAGVLAGMQVLRPEWSRSGFYVDATGLVVTEAAQLEGCDRVTLDLDIAAGLRHSDAARGLALLAPADPLLPPAVARLQPRPPEAGTAVVLAGYSFGERLPAPALTHGALDAPLDPAAADGQLTLALPAMAGDLGGPVLDPRGQVIGMLAAAAEPARRLPEGIAFARGSGEIIDFLSAAGIAVPAPAGAGEEGALSPDRLAAEATGMTVLVSCWRDG